MKHSCLITLVGSNVSNYEMEKFEIKDLREKLLCILCHQKKNFFFRTQYKNFRNNNRQLS